MAYIGNIPAEKFTSVDIQNFTVSATANYTLDRPVANENEIELFINNVRQHPGSGKAYTASGTALTLSEATAGTDTMYCVYQGKARQTVTPATSSVTNAMLAGSIDLTSKVTGALPQANIADQAINEAKMQISNAPTNGYMLTAQSGNTGGLTWAEAPSGGFTLLSSLNGSGVTHVNASVDNIFTSTYDIYRMVGFMAPSQDAEARIKLRSGGSDVSDGNYNWINMASYVPDSSSTVTDVLHSSHGQDFWEFGSADINSDNDSDVVAFDFTLHDPNTNMLSRSYMTGHSVFRNGGSAKLYSELFGGGRESNPDADGIKFYFSGGTMRYYRINIYGAKQS